MKVLLFGGFLGSGKTTVIAEVIRLLQAQQASLCVIENEVGEYSIDGATLSETQVQVTNLSGGCVCCQMTGDLIGALRDIHDRYAPDWVIVELSGLARLSDIPKKLAYYLSGDITLRTVTVLDAGRLEKLLRVASPILNDQIAGGDLLIFNKMDLAEDFPSLTALLPPASRSKPLLPLSPTQDKEPLLAALERLWKEENP